MAELVESDRPLAVLVAPAGYGKTALLEQWRDRDPRPFAWVALSREHDDPAQLLDAIASALRDGSALGAADVVLVLDRLDLLRAAAARAVVAHLAGAVPRGSTMALASRHDPGLPLGRFRAQDDLVEVRADRLAMTRSETHELLCRAGLAVSTERALRLHAATLGWPVALELAARAAHEQEGRPGALDDFRGDERAMGEYVREELLSDLAPADIAFLRRTAVLEQLPEAAWDAALTRCDSAATLRRLAGAGVPLVARDRTGLAFRLHPVLAQALRAELGRVEPELEPVLHRRASVWCERQGDLDGAVEWAVAGRDAERAGALLAARAPLLVAAGRATLVEGWLARLGEVAVERTPSLAVAAAVCGFARGDSEAVERRASAATGVPERAIVLAAAGRDGIESMAREAGAATPEGGPWGSLGRLVEGSARLVLGERDAAVALLEDGARRALDGMPLIRSLCLAELAFLALERRSGDDATALAARARSALLQVGEEPLPLAALTDAVSALVHAEAGRLESARADSDSAAARLAALPDPPPWYAALVLVALARVHLRLSDASACREALSEAGRLRRQASGAVALQTWIDEAWGQADDYAAGPVAQPSTLTMAELRVLRLLPSHLSFREIGERLHVSANTVKTQAHAVYRKLDARSRSQAVAHATAIGLVDP